MGRSDDGIWRLRRYFADPEGQVWEAVVATGITVGDDRRVHLPD
jgi:hypothetical protein